ncbi:baseplate J/gp47 family protein [Aureimonas phyllosphaerae]|uniref:Phage-related baseplate assembly protein n=1 Tax=Aureimonas phyllosphaerae TaxID=1166078 RepID=A0A7W6FW43_9HYPH|nr:baseplate J/gp47 family protein [Aureimonas phyllosphaerae]MBB3937934.1 phage-related baseplate assembly protein [Aureimonas phyllosphaerae]MBB3961893.1 phage-related baseplate assembly protein [Aureimonas phyllosphaerae]SFF54497.1 Phage-related baseplate assembly protein [Aureimonas phyllosphaerae]
MRAPTAIDLSLVPLPAAIQPYAYDEMRAAFTARFVDAWNEERQRDPSLPAYTIGNLEANPVAVGARAFTFLRMLDRQRVNDVLRALFPTTATGDDLAALVARQGIQRQVLVPATADAPAVMESDPSLLNRYLLSFDRGSAGSEDRYLYEAHSAWPSGLDADGRPIGLWDARVNGFDVHGRRGDTDIVIIGPEGRAPTADERRTVSLACRASHVKPEAVAVAVLPARRVEYAVALTVEIPPGPDASLVRDDILAAVRKAALARTTIGGEIPDGFFRGVAYGNGNVISAVDEAPVRILPDLYAVPVMASAMVTTRVRT